LEQYTGVVPVKMTLLAPSLKAAEPALFCHLSRIFRMLFPGLKIPE
jgi:hypothetical protein